MRKIIGAVAAVASLMYGGAQAQESNYSVSPKVLACAPKVLKRGGTVTLTLGPHHGAEMAIQRGTSRDWNFLVVGGTPPEAKPAMTPEELKVAKRVTLTLGAKGLLSLNGRPTGMTFSKPGRYTIYLSDKLESEADGTICVIQYQP